VPTARREYMLSIPCSFQHSGYNLQGIFATWDRRLYMTHNYMNRRMEIQYDFVKGLNAI